MNLEGTYNVTPEQSGQTLSALIRTWLPGQSWAQVRHLVEARRVLVNGKLCMDPARRLQTLDSVQVQREPLRTLPKQVDLQLRFVDSQVIVVEKPAGVTTIRHPEEKHWPEKRKNLQPTLDEMLARLLAHSPGRPGRSAGRVLGSRGSAPTVRTVHRLDRDTSGLMVFARTPEAERHLGNQFRAHSVLRRYLAIALGVVDRSLTISSNLVRDRGDGRRGSAPFPNIGKHAVTHVVPVERLGSYTLVECQLETGRTHQIRIHLSEEGHPLCGEAVYHRDRNGNIVPDPSQAPRVALHAAELGFVHPTTGETLTYHMDFPPDLARFLERLRAERDKSDTERGQD
jgi:23S rRNA pseudouridine1911/1915/1917 synthase